MARPNDRVLDSLRSSPKHGGPDPNYTFDPQQLAPILRIYSEKFLSIIGLVAAAAFATASGPSHAQPSCDNWPSNAFFETGNENAVRTCLNAGADPNARDSRGWTALHVLAIDSNDPRVIAALIDGGADTGARLQNGMTPLHAAAASNGDIDTIVTLLNGGADPDAEDENEWTPLHWAVQQRGDPVAIATLLGAGADPDSRTTDRRTPLHWAAARTGSEAMIERLLAAGANPNARHSTLGTTPLHVAALLNRAPRAVLVLLDAGAIATTRARSGQTPWDLIQQNAALMGSSAWLRLRDANTDPGAEDLSNVDDR